MKTPFAIFAALLVLLTCFSSCDLINPDEEVPSYLEIKAFKLSTNYATQGTASHKIKDAWVYVDNEFIGAYELPARFPVLKQGTHKISIGPGIFDNGIASTRVIYPFFKYYESDVTLLPNQTVTLDTLPVSYFSGKSYTWFEDFEGSGYSLDTLSASLADLSVDTQNPFEGSRCLLMQVTSAKNVLECASINSYAITPGAECYLELNYKCDQAFIMGIIANLPGGTAKVGVISFNPSNEWNKTYVNLRKTIGTYGTAINYNIWFRMDLADGAGVGNAWVDNLKLVNN
jgi:hypothetical protein